MSNVEQDMMLLAVRRAQGPSAANEAAVSWALGRIERGQDTPGLLILAGLSSPFNSFEVDSYLKQALRELGESLPAREDALLWRARDLAGQIVR